MRRGTSRPTDRSLGNLDALVRRASAAGRPDAALAAALEARALSGRRPSGDTTVTTRQLLVWAADLSKSREDREHRLLMAALHDVYEERLGDGDLWERIEAGPPSALRWCAMAGRALLSDRLRAAESLLRAARNALAVEHVPPDATTDDRWPRSSVSTRTRHQGPVVAALETVAAALACRKADGRAAVAAAEKALAAGGQDVAQTRAARALLLMGHSYAAGPPERQSALSAGGTAGWADPDPRLLLLRGEGLVLAGELAAGAADLEHLVRLHDARPDHPGRVRALERLAMAHFLSGTWQEAEAAVDRIGVGEGGPAGQALRTMLAAVRGTGPAPPNRKMSAPAVHAPYGQPEPDRAVIAVCAEVIAMLAHRHYGKIMTACAALTAGDTGLGDAPDKFAPLWLPVRTEAAIETGTAGAARAGLADLSERGVRSPYLLVTFHRLAAREAEQRDDLTAAEQQYRAGLQLLAECSQVPPLDAAKLCYAYGRFLCSLGRMADGNGWLRRALDAFTSLGALPFARRCMQIDAGPALVPSQCASIDLTGREAVVAKLVTSGLTNRQVAEELLISAKAVEYHLGKIYQKFGVSTRGELSSRWPS